MIYTKDFAFLHITRTGGTSIKWSVLNNCPDAEMIPEGKNHYIYNIHWRPETKLDYIKQNQKGKFPYSQENLYQHYPYWHWQSLLNLEDKWVFSVVRDPFKRAASLYDFITKHLKYDITFYELFTLHYSEKYNVKTTQTESLTDCNGKVLENVFKNEEGFKRIEERLGFKIISENVSKPYNYLDYYDEKNEKLIVDLFEKDFENFSYKPSLP